MALLFTHGQKLLFIGDSITDAGRSPILPLGDGYVRRFQDLTRARYPDLNLSILNRGISGETTRDLLGRWERDVIHLQPDWLFIKVGINDVWSMIDGFFLEGISLEEFEINYRSLIEQTEKHTRAKVVLIEPLLVEKNRQDNFRKALAHYQEKVAQLADEYHLLSVKLQQAFDKGLLSQPAGYWAEDRVHPTPVGHALIAEQILAVCGYEWS